MKLLRLALFGLPTLAALAHAGCSSPVCTELGCESNLTFDFDGEYLAAGDYEVSVVSSNGEASCELTVEEDRSSEAVCSGDFELDPSVRDVVVYDTPETATLEITQDDAEVTSLEATPEYSDYYPNGEDCDLEACQVAFASTELP
jgi:hypothetical protein